MYVKAVLDTVFMSPETAVTLPWQLVLSSS